MHTELCLQTHNKPYMCIYKPLNKLCQAIVVKIEFTAFDAIETPNEPPYFSSPHHFGCVCSLL